MKATVQNDSQALHWMFDKRACQATESLDIPPASPRRRLRLRSALRSLRELLADAESTEKALDLEYAVGQRAFERQFERFCRDSEGLRLLASPTSLADSLSDREALERLPEGSLGRAYLGYLDANGFMPRALLELEHEVQQRWADEGVPPHDPARLRYRERVLLTHDLHHVLTDYGTDGIGEATLLAFDLGQSGGLVAWMLNIGASLKAGSRVGPSWFPYVRRAWLRGRRANELITLPFEDMLSLPLDRVRAIAHIEPTARAHPDGICRGVVGAA